MHACVARATGVLQVGVLK